ncbi:MAG: glycogen/starch synthase [Gammaproteobacteria bacterium]
MAHQLSVCYLTSELAPFAKAGGLADVSTALARYLHGLGHDVRVFMPLYGASVGAIGHLAAVEFLTDVPLRIGNNDLVFSVRTAPLPGAGPWVYFIDCPALYHRATYYTEDADEHLRFILLCRATLEACQRMGWGPQIFHCNDWQSALIPLFLRTLYGWDKLFAKSRTLLGIHNIGYQGVFSSWTLGDLALGGDAYLLHQDDLRAGMINFLKTGILYATALVTVSPTYAQEICTPTYGMGLDGLLRARREALTGILNGVDYTEWNPETDPFIPFHFSRADLAGKEKNKRELLHRLGLDDVDGAPVLGIISRLVAQKGFDLLYTALPGIIRGRDLRLAVLGSGAVEYEEFFSRLQRENPGKVCFWQGFNNELAHLIEAGADIFLMPSRYEPCGLNQMYSLKYGTIPVVRKTGGLADTVRHYNPTSGDGTGVVFEHYNHEAMNWALDTVLDLYINRQAWQHLRRNAMAEDFSWERQGARYLELYWHLAGPH